MNAKEFDEKLAAIAKRAKELREAGVIGRVTIGDVVFDLDAPDSVPAQGDRTVNDRGNVLDDPDTFGGNLPERRQFLQRSQAIDDEE